MSAIKTDYRTARLSPADRSMLDFAVKLTLEPTEMTRADVTGLCDVGFDDVAILDIVQVTGFFAYYNRLADGLGIESEPEWGAPLNR